MAGFSNYLRNKLVDFLNRSVAFTPPATVYVTLCSTAPSAATAGTELSGTGYARIALAQSTTAMSATNGDGLTTNPSTGTTGVTSNNATIDWGVAPAAWGTASHWETYDALTGGNRLQHGVIVDAVGTPTPRSIAIGDPVSFPAAAMRVNWA